MGTGLVIGAAGTIVVIAFVLVALLLHRDKPSNIRSIRLGVFFERDTVEPDEEEPRKRP